MQLRVIFLQDNLASVLEKMMEVKLLFRFMVVLYLFMAPNWWCYAGRSRFPKNKHVVKSIKSPDGDIIDCVHISHQPAFDHPLLKNHTIKMRPSYHPNWIKDDNITSTKGKAITQLWHSNGKCPKGTIPILRTNEEDVSKYVKKKKSLPFAYSIDPEFTSVNENHEYAIVRTQGNFFGTKATFNLWNPKVQENDEFSLTQLWVTAGPDSDVNTIEAGWQVYQGKYKDATTRLFIFWTSDGYKQYKCYNLDCPGFIQTNTEIAIGGSLSPTSQVDGSQYEMTILIWKESKEGLWWMQVNGNVIGYWPASLFSYLSESSSRVEWGGEVINLRSGGHHTTTQMGSGHFPQEGYRKASYIRNIEIVDDSNTLRSPQDLLTITPQESCYDIVKGINDNWGSHVFYGGPGQNPNCP
ncbi:putative neprosin [Helianthus annuus]|nr:putative neprosin [Helianthus annuus]KAJ0783612.1 putative neprosin [Helianthus annuus]